MFLHGLNFEYDPMEKLPSLSERPNNQSCLINDAPTQDLRGEYCTYYKRPGHTKDTCYKLYGKDKVLEQMGGNKGPT
ncbi:hypothetical protein CR513_29705, partial [Mucuna pruriens]